MGRSLRALSVLELVIALGILAALLLCLTAFFLGIWRATSKQDDLTAGTAFAQMQMDRAVLNGTYANSAANLSGQAYSHDSHTQTLFTYSLTSTEVPLPPPSTQSAYFVEVTVSWWDGRRSGVGNLSTRLSRLVTPP
ncbi:MAG: hypothetical protein J0I12_15960 [Candidatus Eremiobacteraeota bacterium]|nr:hypothetical protein [Candidatus Eremiobacteraeota bacterium]